MRRRLPADSAQEFAQTVRAAALFALLLELQGRSESSITGVLDRTFDASTDNGLGTVADVNGWLAHVRHRFDLALAEETMR